MSGPALPNPVLPASTIVGNQRKPSSTKNREVHITWWRLRGNHDNWRVPVLVAVIFSLLLLCFVCRGYVLASFLVAYYVAASAGKSFCRPTQSRAECTAPKARAVRVACGGTLGTLGLLQGLLQLEAVDAVSAPDLRWPSKAFERLPGNPLKVSARGKTGKQKYPNPQGR